MERFGERNHSDRTVASLEMSSELRTGYCIDFDHGPESVSVVYTYRISSVIVFLMKAGFPLLALFSGEIV